jgi:hypothetical protein
MMEHTALVVDNKTLIVVVTFRAWKMNEEIKEGIIAEHVEKKVRHYRELVHKDAFKRCREGSEVLLQGVIKPHDGSAGFNNGFFSRCRGMSSRGCD